MPTNLEVKAVWSTLAHADLLAHRLPARRVDTFHQKDTYYRVPSGRLKLREINRRRFELIYYRRPNARTNRLSHFSIVPLHSPTRWKRLFASLFGVLVVVSKVRRLYLYKNARIHVDTVRGLGTYIEFEVRVTKGHQQARDLLKKLMTTFHIPRTSCIGVSYSDLLLDKQQRSTI
jgi:predicted adenylyl cyclase CyaB